MSISREERKGSGSSSGDESSGSGSYEVKSDVEGLPQPAHTNKINRGLTYSKGGGVNGMQKLFGQKDLSEEDEADSSAAEEEEKREKKKTKMKKLKIKKKNDDLDELARLGSIPNSDDLQNLFKNIVNIKNLSQPENTIKRDLDMINAANEQKNPEEPRISQKLLINEEDNTKDGDLTFGSYITISIENEKEQREKQKNSTKAGNKSEHRKFFTKFRISDTVRAEKMSKENYDSN